MDIRKDETYWYGGKNTYAAVDPEKLEDAIREITDDEDRQQAIRELIEAVREADSDQSCGCM